MKLTAAELDRRADALHAKYRAIQARTRDEIRRRVAANEPIPMKELLTRRTLGIARAQWERMEAEAARLRERERKA